MIGGLPPSRFRAFRAFPIPYSKEDKYRELMDMMLLLLWSLSSPGPKPLVPKPPRPDPNQVPIKTQGIQHPASRIDKFSAGRTKCRSTMLNHP